MKKNKVFLFVLICTLLTACSEKRAESLVSHVPLSENFIPERNLASSDSSLCMRDLFSIEILKKEIQDLENQYKNATKVKGRWKHLNLSALPVPAANFLLRFGDKLGDLSDPDAIDYSECSDVPCLFNKVYGKHDHVAGYVHYLWYLKFGHMLSASNFIDGQESKEAGVYNNVRYPLSSYLYDEKELRSFWRLSHMLKARFTKLKSMYEIQRIPRGSKIEGRAEDVCGYATSKGYIKLADECLETDRYQVDSGAIYHLVTHELGHIVDFEEDDRSLKKDYLDIVQMYPEEKTVPLGQVKKWNYLGNAQFVTEYAKTSPLENFAETMALFRHKGDKTYTSVSKEHFNFFSKNYYQNQSFIREALFGRWIDSQESLLANASFQAVMECSRIDSKTFSNFFIKSDFKHNLLPSMLNCLGLAAESLAESLKAKSLMTEPEACHQFNLEGSKALWHLRLKSKIIPLMSHYLDQMNKDVDYLAKVQSFYDQIPDNRLSKNAYINCYQKAEEQKCYTNEVKKIAYEEAKRLSLPESHQNELSDLYVSFHPYSEIQEQVQKAYQVLVNSHESVMKEEASAIWSRCHAINPKDNISPSGDHIQLKGGYMISSHYNCLNMSFPEAVRKSIRRFSLKGKTVINPQEELILTKEVSPRITKYIYDLYDEARTREASESKTMSASTLASVKTKVMRFDWLLESRQIKELNTECAKAVYTSIPYLPIYHLKKDLFGSLAEENICKNIEASTEYSNTLSRLKTEFLNDMTNKLEEKVYQEATSEAKKCLSSYPMDTNLNRVKFKKERENCLIKFWPTIEARVLRSFSSDPLVINDHVSQDDAKKNLETNRRRIQIQVLKENFAN